MYPQQGIRQELQQLQVLIVGVSPHAEAIRNFARRAGKIDHTILLQGETGVGKDHLAEVIHTNGQRKNQAFVPVDCGVLTESLMETELFGHTPGAFTGARSGKQGLVEIADGGTIFFDEIANLSLLMQAKFLRVVERRAFRAVGDTREVTVNIRIIAATNVDLGQAVAEGRFRSDLYHRLNEITFTVSPLRERTNDVTELARHFLVQEGEGRKFAPDALAVMENYHWPGNVRELKNAVTCAVFECPENENIQAIHIHPYLVQGNKAKKPPGSEETAGERWEVLYNAMVKRRESYWAVVHLPFLEREIDRSTVRAIIRKGLTETRGNYRSLARLFNIPSDPEETGYKRFLNHLRKHKCQLPYKEFR